MTKQNSYLVGKANATEFQAFHAIIYPLDADTQEIQLPGVVIKKASNGQDVHANLFTAEKTNEKLLNPGVEDPKYRLQNLESLSFLDTQTHFRPHIKFNGEDSSGKNKHMDTVLKETIISILDQKKNRTA